MNIVINWHHVILIFTWETTGFFSSEPSCQSTGIQFSESSYIGDYRTLLPFCSEQHSQPSLTIPKPLPQWFQSQLRCSMAQLAPPLPPTLDSKHTNYFNFIYLPSGPFSAQPCTHAVLEILLASFLAWLTLLLLQVLAESSFLQQGLSYPFN